MAPAWMAELSEEWIEPEPEPGSGAEVLDEEEDDTQQQQEHKQPSSLALDFGSLEIKDTAHLPNSSGQLSLLDNLETRPAGTTTIFHDAAETSIYQNGSILFSPVKKRPAQTNNNRSLTSSSSSSSPPSVNAPEFQLAMAAKAFNKDLLQEGNNKEDESAQATSSVIVNSSPKKTPNRLQSLFFFHQQPSPSPSLRQEQLLHHQQQDHSPRSPLTLDGQDTSNVDDGAEQTSFVVVNGEQEEPVQASHGVSSRPMNAKRAPVEEGQLDRSHEEAGQFVIQEEEEEVSYQNGSFVHTSEQELEQECEQEQEQEHNRNNEQADMVEQELEQEVQTSRRTSSLELEHDPTKSSSSLLNNINSQHSHLLAQLPSTEFSFRVEQPLPPRAALSSYLPKYHHQASAEEEEEEEEEEASSYAAKYKDDNSYANAQASTSKSVLLNDLATSTPSSSIRQRHVNTLSSSAILDTPAPDNLSNDTPEPSFLHEQHEPHHHHHSNQQQQHYSQQKVTDTIQARTNSTAVANVPKPSPALSIFKFNQDTYTRQHLQALVAEIDGLTSPPRPADQRGNTSISFLGNLDLSHDSQGGMPLVGGELLAASRGMYRQQQQQQNDSDDVVTEVSEHGMSNERQLQRYQPGEDTEEESQQQQQFMYRSPHAPYDSRTMEMTEDENGRTVNTRSSKRVRLSASDFRPQPPSSSSERISPYYSPFRSQQQQHHQAHAQFSGFPSSPISNRITNRVMPSRYFANTPPGSSASRTRTRRTPFSASRLLHSQQGRNIDWRSRARSRSRSEGPANQVNMTGSPARPLLRSLPPMTEPVRRTYRSAVSSHVQAEDQTAVEEQEDEDEEEVPEEETFANDGPEDEEQEEEEQPPVETPPSRWRKRQDPTPELHGRTPAHAVQDRLQEAKALMERIRQRNSDRQGHMLSSISEIGTTTQVLVPAGERSPVIAVTPESATATIRSPSSSSIYLNVPDSKRRPPLSRQSTLSRPSNPTPTAAALAYQLRESNPPRSMAATPEEEEESFNAQSAVDIDQDSERQNPKLLDRQADTSVPVEEQEDELAPLPQIGNLGGHHSTMDRSAKQSLTRSPMVHQASRHQSDSTSLDHAGPSTLGSTSRRTFATAPTSSAGRPPAQLQQGRRHPTSLSSQASSDRFFTSTSSRYVSGSTAPTSLVASSIGAMKDHLSVVQHGIFNIPPEEAENLLTKDVLGDMVFDDIHKRWVKIDKYLSQAAAACAATSSQAEAYLHHDGVSPARAEGPALSPTEEMPALAGDGTSDDDPFRDITGFENSKSRSQGDDRSGGRDDSKKHNRSGSLVLPLSTSQLTNSQASTQHARQAAEKTSTPPHLSSALAFVSPDLPSIPQASSSQVASRSTSVSAPTLQSNMASSSNSEEEARSGSRRSSTENNMPPRSVLKRSDRNAFSTPLPSSKVIARLNSRQPRSVSFSDGKVPGRGDSFERNNGKVVASALRHEVREEYSNGHISLSHDNGDERQEAEGAEDDDTISLNAYTSTITKNPNQVYQQGNSRGESSRQHVEPDTPTAVHQTFARPRSLRLRSRGLESHPNSVVSTTSTLAWHRKPLNANATILTECSFGVSYDRLLRVLTDVVPFEPSWKDLRSIDLRERGLESAVRLKEFLPHLDEALLSNNCLSYLTGLPGSIRFLSLANNNLSDLSSFTYLRSLETLDISGNRAVTSVRQLACLQHLRDLKANNCAIDSIEGIENLDGLVTLNLCNNALMQLRLEETSWSRLETLDVADNEISVLSGVDTLPALKAMNLDYNRITDFYLSRSSPSLRIVKISNNSLESLDLSHLPNVRTVFADSNRIMNISGTESLRKLENLSLREQRQGSIEFPVKDLRDLRRLYLSYNPIPEAFPNEHFLNLTLLELSGCRLTSLPNDFASVVPNCRVLILDNNFLETLAPVSGAKRLRAISAVGNRLEKVKDLLGIWLECTELESLDLRLNPMTLGFYASPNLSVAPPNLNLLPSEDSTSLKEYKALDTQHRHILPNEWLAIRMAYRALVIEAAPALRMLDGLKVGRTQRHRARELVERFAC